MAKTFDTLQVRRISEDVAIAKAGDATCSGRPYKWGFILHMTYVDVGTKNRSFWVITKHTYWGLTKEEKEDLMEESLNRVQE